MSPMNTTPTPSPPRISTPRFAFGLACLVLAVGASAVLVARHLHLFSPPGCGEGSACDRAAASLFGTVPLLGWPTSFVGLAYFAALAAAWTAAARRAGSVPVAFHNVARAGVAWSAMFLGVMIVGSYVCLYCIAAHVGNFLFLMVLEPAPRDTGRCDQDVDASGLLDHGGVANTSSRK